MSITLLLDNSGSMRGQKIVAVASFALLLIKLLERWKIRTEVLGYTTKAWKGGQSRELWLEGWKT
jgi:cobaltochelatase CobT